MEYTPPHIHMKRSLFCWIVCFFISAFHLQGATAEWLTDLPTALAKAKAENKSVLIDFTGSDWCGWCMRLKKEVFDQPEFAAYAEKKLILVELDFPNKKRQSAELKAANAKLAQKYNVKGFPTIYILDADGKTIGQSEYRPGGAAKYVANLEKFVKTPVVTAAAPAKPVAATVPVTKTPPVQAKPAPGAQYTKLALKGITGSKDRRFALINNQTLAVGEKAKVKLGGGQIEILCQEIRDDSVLIQVENETEPKQLNLEIQ